MFIGILRFLTTFWWLNMLLVKLSKKHFCSSWKTNIIGGLTNSNTTCHIEILRYFRHFNRRKPAMCGIIFVFKKKKILLEFHLLVSTWNLYHHNLKKKNQPPLLWNEEKIKIINQKFTLVVVVKPLCTIISASNCLPYQKRYIKYYITYKTFSKQLCISTTTVPQRAAGFFLFTSADYRINQNLDPRNRK